MRLCIVSPFPPGMRGIAEYGYHMARGLAREAAINHVIVLADSVAGAPAEEECEGVLVRRVWRRDDPAVGPRILQAIADARPQVVWYNVGLSMFGGGVASSASGLLTPLLTRLMGLPTVVTLHEVLDTLDLEHLGVKDQLLARWGGRVATSALLQANAVCVTLEAYATILRQRYAATNVVHMPHGLFQPPLAAPRCGTGTKLLMLAAHGPHKGLPVLLEAYRRLRAEMPGLELMVVGDDHPRFPGYLGRVVADWGQTSGVRWFGYLPEPDLATAIAEAMVVVVPSIAATGASSVVYRAAAAGTPVVASDLADLRSLASESNFAIDFTPPGDVVSLIATLRSLLADPKRRLALGQHNLQAARNCTLEHTCNSYLQLFHHLLSSQRPLAELY